METLTISKFKATCLSVLKDVDRQKKKVVITKRGKPIAEVIPVADPKKPKPLKETVLFVGDIVSPVSHDDWEASK